MTPNESTGPAEPANSGVRTLAWFAICAVVGVLVGLAFRYAKAPPTHPSQELAGNPADGPRTGLFEEPVGQVAEFECVERSGRKVRTSELRGPLTAVTFIFTRCGYACPRLADQVRRLQDATKGASDLSFVSFSVDPENDTPEVLSRFADEHGADRTRWLFLRPADADVQAAARSLKLNADPDDPLLHSNEIVLLDAERRGIALYRPLDDANWLDTCLADLAKLRAAAGR